MKRKFVLLILFSFVFSGNLLAQRFNLPRIIGHSYDKWFLERLLREDWQIPYSTVTIEKFEPHSILVSTLRNSDISIEELEEYVGQIMGFINRHNVVRSLAIQWRGVTNYHMDITVEMIKGLKYYLQCDVSDYIDHQRFYFNSCDAKYIEVPEDFDYFFGKVRRTLEPLELDYETFTDHLPRLCRNCETSRLADFLRVGNSWHWPLEQKPYIDYSSFYDLPAWVDFTAKSMRFQNDPIKDYAEIDFFDLLHPYFGRGTHVIMRPVAVLHFPEDSRKGLLLKTATALKVVDENYHDSTPYCIIKKGYYINRPSSSVWEEEYFVFSFSLGKKDSLPHNFKHEYQLHPFDMEEDQWFMMSCFNTPMLSFGDFLEMIEGKFEIHMVN
ncbi:MAG: hypothetical protein OXB84_05835 [Halobacteriovoraceae bacterium]|nr:hypothetical protein [Halobacteriovoraceae bacterium]